MLEMVVQMEHKDIERAFEALSAVSGIGKAKCCDQLQAVIDITIDWSS